MFPLFAAAVLAVGALLTGDPSMAYDPLGTFHVLAAGAALAAGTAVAVAPKGSARHRFLGRVYLGAMLALNASALLIYDLTGRANLFHFFALVSLASVLSGFIVVRRRRDGWRRRHARAMLWSYAGLLAATVSELLVRVPGLAQGAIGFGAAVGVATTVTMAMAAWLIRRSLAGVR